MRPIESGLTFEVLRGVEVVRARLIDLARTCTQSLWAFQPGPVATDASIDAARPLDEATLSRGVEMRSLYLDSVRNHMPALDHAEWLTDRGAEVRTVPAMPMRMLIIDGKTAVFPIDPDNSQAGGIATSNWSVLSALSALFEEYWRAGSPFGRRRPRRTGLLNARELQAIRLWRQGHTQEVVARRMGVSVRTVYRYSDTVREVLQAGSAFQAGFRAAELEMAGESPESVAVRNWPLAAFDQDPSGSEP
jgi:DNA-binding CsgD family transcriptional regulator